MDRRAWSAYLSRCRTPGLRGHGLCGCILDIGGTILDKIQTPLIVQFPGSVGQVEQELDILPRLPPSASAWPGNTLKFVPLICVCIWPTTCVSSCFLFPSCQKISHVLDVWAGRLMSAAPSSCYSRESSICQETQGCYEYRFYRRIFGSIGRCLFMSVALTYVSYVSNIPLTSCVLT